MPYGLLKLWKQINLFIHQIFIKHLLCTQTLIGTVQRTVPDFKDLTDELGKQANINHVAFYLTYNLSSLHFHSPAVLYFI